MTTRSPSSRCGDESDVKFLTEKGRYVDHIAPPGMLYLAILRSPQAHARVIGIDLSAARTFAAS
jgi:carbon-monoxide dehydrogenase large subunit